MFERRLKIFLLILLCATGVLVLRALQLQVLGREHWQQKAVEAGKRRELIETTRGTIHDRNNVAIAVDEPCQDACVDYRALIDPPDPTWLAEKAAERLTRSMGNEYKLASRERRKQLREPEIERVKQDINKMWAALARDSKRELVEIEDARRAVVQKVEMRQRVLWYMRYRAAMDDQAGRGPSTWYRKWLIGDAADAPEVDSFVTDVREQKESHPIINDIDNETLIALKKNLEKYPGLEIRDGVRRRYPYKNVACHVLGNLSRVRKEDVDNDPNLAVNPLRRYELNDMIGRSGLEALCEPALRGTRGYLERESGRADELARVEAVPGKPVKTTIDIKLQADIERLFQHVSIKNDDNSTENDVEMHGAAVVIDVASGGVLAMASWPTYDADRFNELYAKLVKDDLNKPLFNRATQWAIEPGSTVKPIIGLGAITDDRLLVNQGIECTGYLVHRGRKIMQGFRCWTASKYDSTEYANLVPHHQIPHPHQGHHGNPDGHLTFADAIERSCNVYFETAAGMMGVGGVLKWYDRFGLGRVTGVGINESPGRIPDPLGMQRSRILQDTWFAGIGQGQVGATTIQMANVAATIARDGVWVRPHLVGADTPTTRPAGVPEFTGPDTVDLKIPPAALAAAKQGMVNVMYGRAGTANLKIPLPPVRIAGKTGTAETRTPLRTKRLGEDGKEIKVKAEVRDAKGELIRVQEKTVYDYYEPVSPQNPSGMPGWYRGFGSDGKKLKHAWFIGFAPAERPTVAFAVMVEYGGSGGFSALSVASGALKACIEHKYVPANADLAMQQQQE